VAQSSEDESVEGCARRHTLGGTRGAVEAGLLGDA